MTLVNIEGMKQEKLIKITGKDSASDLNLLETVVGRVVST